MDYLFLHRDKRTFTSERQKNLLFRAARLYWEQKYADNEVVPKRKVDCELYKYVLYYLETLSKILCKWKQDSVVSLFLYLDSVFKHKHKLIHNQAPVRNRHCPFLFNLHKRKINGLFYSIIRRE